MTKNTNEKTLLYQTICGVACGAYSIDEGYKRVYDQLQKTREEALARENQLKQVHMMELDAISCKSIEEFVVWRDQRKQRPNHSELDQDNK